MGHPAPRHKTPDRKIRRAVAHEAKEWGITLAFWGVVTSPLFVGALLGWLWAAGVIAMWVVVIVVIFLYLIAGGRSNVQLRNPAYREARTRQWYMGDPLPPLEPPVNWERFETMLEKDLRNDPWKPMDDLTQAEFLRIASRDEPPMPIVPDADGYSIDQRTGEVIYEQIYVDQCSEPVLMPVGQYPPLPTEPTEVFSMICSNCQVRSVPRSTGLCKPCESIVSPFSMPEMELTTDGARRSLKNALASVYAVPGEMIIPTLRCRMSKAQIEEALNGVDAARRRDLIVSLRKAGIIQ
jgi:hypothetical protein